MCLRVGVLVPHELSRTALRPVAALEDTVSMLLALFLLLFQTRNVPGVLDGPDPKQMENAPPLGYHAVETGLSLPEGMKLGASSAVAFDAQGHMWVLNRGEHPLMEFDQQGKFVRASARASTTGHTECASRPTGASGRPTCRATRS